MKITIITNGFYYSDKTKYQVERLTAEAEKQNIIVEHFDNSNILGMIERNNCISNLKTDCVIYLDKDIHIGYMLEKSGLKVINNIKSIELTDDKIRTYIELSNNNINMPKTISSPLMYKNENDNKFVENLEKQLKYPIVVKEAFGSLGQQVYKIENHKELIEIRNKLKFKPHLYQEFVKSSFGKDVRVIVIGNKVVASYMRVSNGEDFRSNIELGGYGKNIELKKDFKEMAEKVSKILNLNYCGVDIMFGKNNEPILCEVNSNAFFKGAEYFTKINIAKLYIDHILKTIK